MSLLKYSESDLRGLLCRAIRVRWPAEKLLVLTGCHKVSSEAGHYLPPDLELAAPRMPPVEAESGSERGFLAVTQSRLIFQEEVSTGLLLRSISLVIGVLSV